MEKGWGRGGRNEDWRMGGEGEGGKGKYGRKRKGKKVERTDKVSGREKRRERHGKRGD